MVDLLDAAHALHRFMRAQGWQYCFIGGFALQHWGEPRLTLDIDLTLLAEFGDEARFVDGMLEAFEPRIAGAREFALERRVLLLRSAGGVDIDVALGALPFEVAAVERSKVIEMMPGREVRLCSAEDLVVFKAFADRPRDWLDIETILARQGVEAIDWAYIDAMLGELAALKEQPELLSRLQRLREAASRS
jgi:hypothetical protein